MGVWLTWTVAEDLTADEVGRVLDVFSRRMVPALRALAAEKRPSGPEPLPLLVRLGDWASRHVNRRYAEAPDSFMLDPDGLTIAPLHVPSPARIRFRMGEYGCQTVGFEDYAVLGALAVMASETCKVVLTSGDEMSQDHVLGVLRRLERASGYQFWTQPEFMGSLPATADAEGPDADGTAPGADDAPAPGGLHPR